MKPSNIEDISSILALYSPGPLDAGLIPKFINRKHGREEIEYDTQILEPILNETYGIMCREEGLRLTNELHRLTVPGERNIPYGELALWSNS